MNGGMKKERKNESIDMTTIKKIKKNESIDMISEVGGDSTKYVNKINELKNNNKENDIRS
jgi:hypothetical protein